jgi:hypothetical protein
VSSPTHLRTETDPVSKTLCFLVSRILDDGQVQNPSYPRLQTCFKKLNYKCSVTVSILHISNFDNMICVYTEYNYSTSDNIKMTNIPSGFVCCKRLGGSTLGNSKFRSLRLINLHAMLNSSIFILPSASVSASDLHKKVNYNFSLKARKKCQSVQKRQENNI